MFIVVYPRTYSVWNGSERKHAILSHYQAKKKKKSQAHTLISSDNQELVTEKESEVLTSGGWGAADGIVY